MNDTSASSRRVTPEFILAVLVEEHRQQSQYDPEADPSATLSLTTTIAEWRDACDLLPWRQLGSALTEHWQISASDDDWQRVLEPARQRTLLDVCGFISERAELPDLVPRGYLGAHCSAAAAFLGVRSALAAVGQDVSGITPSTELAPYLRSAAQVFLTFGARTSPGSLPPIRIETPGYDRCFFALILSFIGCFVAACFRYWWLGIAFVVLGACAWFGTYYFARLIPPRRVSFGDLQTFADYALTLANRNS